MILKFNKNKILEYSYSNSTDEITIYVHNSHEYKRKKYFFLLEEYPLFIRTGTRIGKFREKFVGYLLTTL